MAREIIRGPTWYIGIEIAYLPQASLEWWRKLLRKTKGAFERQKRLQTLLNHIQSPDTVKAYMELIPTTEAAKIQYRETHGGRCTVPSTGQLNLFYKRLPNVVKLLEDELNKY